MRSDYHNPQSPEGEQRKNQLCDLEIAASESCEGRNQHEAPDEFSSEEVHSDERKRVSAFAPVRRTV